MAISGTQIITDLEEALSLDHEDQFIIYQNSTRRTKRVKRGNLFLSRGIRVTGKFIDSEIGNDVGLTAATALNNSATALISASGAQASADGKNKVYYSATEPSLASILGYINNTTLTVNSVTSGIPIYVGMPLVRASAPAVAAGTKVSAFLGTSGGQAGQYTVSISQTAGSAGSPISITGGDFEDGDIWYDIDDNYKQYVRSGGVWKASFAPMIRFGTGGIISGLLRADQYGGTSAMDFVLVAEKFQVWNGTSAEVPFEIVPIGTSGDQVVRIKNAQIQTVDAGKITAGFLGAQVINVNGSSATGTAGAGGYIESTNFVPTWQSGALVVRQYMTTGAYGAFLGKQSPSDTVQVKIAQPDGSYKLFRSKQDQGSSGATNAPISTGGTNAYWEEVSVPTFNVQIGDENRSVQNLGFRIVSNGFNEFNGALFRGAVIANEGFFGSTKNAVRLDSSGLTVGNYGYLKSRGVGYNGTEFFASSGTSGGFFLGNTQAEGQADLYQLFVGKPLGNSLWWNGNSLLVNGNLVAESASGSSGAGLTINSGFGIRYKDDNAVLTITGGKTNGSSSGAQIDLVGTRYENVNRGALVLSAGYLDPWPGTSGINSGAIHFRTGNDLVGLWRSDKTFDIYSSVRMSGVVYAGSADPAVAPFRISTSGILTATAAILQAAVISGSSAISGDTDVGGRLAAILADAIDGSGNLITNVLNSKLNTQSAQILDSFSFGTSGAIQIGSYTSGGTSGDIKISPNGIVGRNSAGDTTFALNGVTGSATFAGQVTALSGNIGGWIINPSNLSKNNATISSTGEITLGSGGESVILSSIDANNRIWVGNATSGLAPFRVSRTGTVTAGDINLAGGEVTGTFNIKSGGFLLFGTGGANGGSLAMSSSYIRAFSYDSSANGSVTFGVNLLNGVGNIGGWTFNRNSLFAGASGSRVGLESDSTSGNVVIYAGSETKASAPFRVTNTGNVTATLGTIGGWTLGSSSLTAGGGITRVGLEVDAGTGGISIYAGSDTKTSAPFRVSNTGVLVAQSGQIGGWNLSSTSLETTSTAYIQAGPNAGNYVRISSSGIIGVSSALGTVFTIPTNGTRPTFSSGEITLTKFTVSTSGIIQTSATVGDGTANSQGILINNIGIRGYAANQALDNPNFYLNANNGNITAKAGEIAGWTISASTLSKNSLTIDSAGNIRAGQTAYNTGTGFWLGIDGSTPKFSLGTSGGNRVTWDGSTLEITGTIKNASVGSAGGTDGLIINSPVGIRTANSNQTLTITGGTSNGITAGAQVDFTGSTVAEVDNRFSLILQAGGAVADLSNASNGRIEFRTNIANNSVNTGCTRADIRKNGALTFYKNQSYNGSTLTYTSGAGCAEFQSNVGIGRSFEAIDGSGNTGGKLHVQTEIAVYTGASTRQIVLTGSNGNISAAGDVSAVSFTTSSSKKVKTNIKKLKSGLETIDKLKPVSFKRKGTKQQDIGLIAEEVDEILPVIVKHNEKNEAEGLDYSKLTVLLINAVKELSAEVKRLEKKIKDANSN